MPPSVFDPAVFRDPPVLFRPLQIVHGLDHLVPPGASPDETTQALASGLRRLAETGVGGIVTNVSFQHYLEDPRQWDLLRAGLRQAVDLGLRIWLYDEKGYPSGSAGGLVTRANPELAALGLVCYTLPVQGRKVLFPLPPSCRAFVWAGAVPSLAQADSGDFTDLSAAVDEWGTLAVELPEEGWTVLYLAERVMYEGTHAMRNVCEFKAYINTLDPRAAPAFLRVTHEAYAREIPPELWAHIDAFFTDEPSFMTQYAPELPERFRGQIPVLDAPIFSDRPPAVPWVSGFLERFRRRKGYDLTPYLYGLFHSESAEACLARQDYYDFISAEYAAGYFGPIQDWCRAHGLASSGHVLLEETLLDHAGFQGSLLAVLRRLDLPGLDMLNCSPAEMIEGGSFMGDSFMAVKQSASAAHLSGAARVHSESSDWEQQNVGRSASLDERRGQANVQYALGVNLITSYFGWEEIGAAGRQAYHEYAGRLSALLTGGRHACDVAVLYPIRTIWAHFLPPLTPMESWETREIRGTWVPRLNQAYPRLVRELILNQIDLDILDEEGLAAARIEAGRLCLGDEAYRAVVLPPLDALGLPAARALLAFLQAGGLVIAAGELPGLADSAAGGSELRQLVLDLQELPNFVRAPDPAGLPALLRARIPPDLVLAQAERSILYTHRVLDGREVYFLCSTAAQPRTLQPSLRAPGPYTLYRPLDGSVAPAPDPLVLTLAAHEGVFLVSASAGQ